LIVKDFCRFIVSLVIEKRKKNVQVQRSVGFSVIVVTFAKRHASTLYLCYAYHFMATLCKKRVFSNFNYYPSFFLYE